MDKPMGPTGTPGGPFGVGRLRKVGWSARSAGVGGQEVTDLSCVFVGEHGEILNQILITFDMGGVILRPAPSGKEKKLHTKLIENHPKSAAQRRVSRLPFT